MKLQQQKLFYIFRLAALIFLLTGLLFSSLLLNIEQIQSDIAFRINLLLSGVLPLLTGTYLIFMVFCPDSWSKYLSGKAVLMATSGCGFIFFHATVSFTEIFLATPAVMSGIVGELGKLAGVGLLTVAFGLWIVEQRDKERMLQDSRNRYRGLVESQQDMIVVADSENRLRFANDAYCRAFGGKRRKLEGGTFEPDVHEDDVENTRENSHKLKTPPYRVSFEQRLLTEKGWRWIEWAKSAVLDENGKITEFQGIGRDITEQKLARQDLHKAKERLQAVISNSPLLICECDLQGRYALVNPAISGMFSLSPDDMIGRSIREFLPPETAKTFEERIKQIRTTQRSIEVEDTLKLDGDERLFRTTLFPLFDVNGKVNAVGAIGNDITNYRKMSRDLRRSEKLAALGELVAGVAHEIKNPLNTMMGFADLLLSREDGITEDVKGDIKRIYNSSQQINNITDGLLSFSRKGKTKKRPIDINKLLRDTLKLKENHLKSWNINVEKKLSHGLPPVEASEEQLGQVFLNLFNNAEYFMRRRGKSGTLTVCTSQVENNAEIKILDSGPGVPENALDKLFSPFFTTKPEGEGTGLGLSVSYGIVKEHGGRLDAKNRKEGGAAFTILLPLTN